MGLKLHGAFRLYPGQTAQLRPEVTRNGFVGPDFADGYASLDPAATTNAGVPHGDVKQFWAAAVCGESWHVFMYISWLPT